MSQCHKIIFLKNQKERGRSQWESNPRPLDSESNAISTPLCDRVCSIFPKCHIHITSKTHRPRSKIKETDKVYRILPPITTEEHNIQIQNQKEINHQSKII
ncbi:hypothetical protein ACJW30_06G164100 [Castanea mollissima]